MDKKHVKEYNHNYYMRHAQKRRDEYVENIEERRRISRERMAKSYENPEWRAAHIASVARRLKMVRLVSALQNLIEKMRNMSKKL